MPGRATAFRTRAIVLGIMVATSLGLVRVAQEDRRLTRQSGGGERRVALVVGNNDYPQAPLRNALNDARAVAQALQELGFSVTKVEDATRPALTNALESFGEQLQKGDVALFYYAGHGVQVEGENYLIPVDFEGQSAAAARLNAVKVSDVQQMLEHARVSMLVLDACRNNPFAGTRGGGGLAVMEPHGGLIAFATRAGQTASDNTTAANGLFTAELLKALREPGLTVQEVFRRVRLGVQEASGGKQTPALYDDVVGDLVLRPRPTAAAAAATPPATADADLTRREELALWESIKGSTNPRMFEDYIRQYPAGRFRVVADERLKERRGTNSAVGVSRPAALAPVTNEKELADARARYDAAFSRYTRLVTTDEQGDVVQALAEYKHAADRLQDLERWISTMDGREMAWISPGEFQMGSPPGEPNRDDDEVQHSVRITQGFWLDTTEVTNAAYQKFVLTNLEWRNDRVDRRYQDGNYLKHWNGTSYPSGQSDQPVDEVSWNAARAYCGWAGKRLPTEAEWEYAARAGTRTAYWWGDEFDADRANNGQEPAAVGDPRRINRWGLADMLGNVWEWTASQYWPYPYRPDDGRNDPSEDAERSRAMRGGAWQIAPKNLRSAMRAGDPPATCGRGVGFRCAR